MAIIDGEVLRSRDGSYYIVDGGSKRRVPDQQTLATLVAGGLPRDHAEQKELDDMELGPAVPSLFEGTVLIDENGISCQVRKEALSLRVLMR